MGRGPRGHALKRRASTVPPSWKRFLGKRLGQIKTEEGLLRGPCRGGNLGWKPSMKLAERKDRPAQGEREGSLRSCPGWQTHRLGFHLANVNPRSSL
jgi:hypothetical protein